MVFSGWKGLPLKVDSLKIASLEITKYSFENTSNGNKTLLTQNRCLQKLLIIQGHQNQGPICVDQTYEPLLTPCNFIFYDPFPVQAALTLQRRSSPTLLSTTRLSFASAIKMQDDFSPSS